jgi:hypothetical protein
VLRSDPALLTLLMLLAQPAQSAFADERRILSVVQRGNIFGPQSDDRERETVPAVRQPRAGQAAIAA